MCNGMPTWWMLLLAAVAALLTTLALGLAFYVGFLNDGVGNPALQYGEENALLRSSNSFSLA